MIISSDTQNTVHNAKKTITQDFIILEKHFDVETPRETV